MYGFCLEPTIIKEVRLSSAVKCKKGPKVLTSLLNQGQNSKVLLLFLLFCLPKERCIWFICLQALIHVSTAYSNCDQKETSEMLYPPPADPVKFVEWLQWMNEDLVNQITPK